MKAIVEERTEERARVGVVYIFSYSSHFLVDTILKPLFRYFTNERDNHNGQVADETLQESESTTKLFLNTPSTTGADSGITSKADDAFQVPPITISTRSFPVTRGISSGAGGKVY